MKKIFFLLKKFIPTMLWKTKRVQDVASTKCTSLVLWQPPIVPAQPAVIKRSIFRRLIKFVKDVFLETQFAASCYVSECESLGDFKKQNILAGMSRVSDSPSPDTKGLVYMADSLNRQLEHLNTVRTESKKRRDAKLYKQAQRDFRKFKKYVARNLKSKTKREQYIWLNEIFQRLYKHEVIYNPIADKNSKAYIWSELRRLEQELDERGDEGTSN